LKPDRVDEKPDANGQKNAALICLIGSLAKKRTFTIMALDWHITIITNQFGQNH